MIKLFRGISDFGMPSQCCFCDEYYLLSRVHMVATLIFDPVRPETTFNNSFQKVIEFFSKNPANAHFQFDLRQDTVSQFFGSAMGRCKLCIVKKQTKLSFAESIKDVRMKIVRIDSMCILKKEEQLDVQ